MAEAKYGRLFTEADVEAIVAGVLAANGCNPTTARHDAANALRAMEQRTTFPADEPLFLLRGQDKLAPDVIALAGDRFEEGEGSYYVACCDAECPDAHVVAVGRAADEMREWQRANPDRVKVPD